jgi:hypothetical protein
MGKYIDLGDLSDQLSSQAINAGQSFLAGKLTNVFNDIGRSPDTDIITGNKDVLTSVAEVGINAAQAAITTNAGVNAVNQAIMNADDLTNALVEMGTQVITENAARIAGDYIDSHTKELSKLPATIQSYAMSYFNAYKLSLSDLLKLQVIQTEQLRKELADKADELSKNEFIKKSKEKITKVTGLVSEMTSQVPTYVNMITSYITQGPVWVESKMDEFVGNKTEEIENLINKQWELDKQSYDDFAQKQGNKVGAKLVQLYNDELMQQAKKIENMKQKAEEKIKIQAKKVLQKSKLMIMGKLGINLPI